MRSGGKIGLVKYQVLKSKLHKKLLMRVIRVIPLRWLAYLIIKAHQKKEAVFFVDCANGERFYVSQNDLANTQEIKSQTEKAISQSEALDSCIQMVKANTKYPSSVNFKMLDSGGFTAKTTGNVVVTLGFEAKNSLGAEVSAKARCVFTPDGESEVNIIEN